MSIDEAITHCLAVADGQTEQGRCPECVEDHRQLAEWLTDYKRLKEQSGDTISRQAAIDRIRNMEEWRTGDAFNADRVIRHIKDLPSVNPQRTEAGKKNHRSEARRWKRRYLTLRQQTRWIPCSERLPKIADVYRVTRYYPNNVMNPNYLVDACFFDGSNTWYNDNKINYERACANNIIAWQENPEPYFLQEKEGIV